MKVYFANCIARMDLRRDRSFNLSIGLDGLEFNEEHFSGTPMEAPSDRGSRIEGELEELNTYARILSNLKQKVITPIQDIILSLELDSPGLRCVKRICSQLTVIEEMIVKFYKYSVQFFKSTTITEDRRIFKNCASCLNAIIKAWEEYLVAYAEADAFEAFEEVTKLPQSKSVIESGYTEFADICNCIPCMSGSIHKEPISSRILSLKLSCLLLITHEERASVVILSNELNLSIDSNKVKDEEGFDQSCDKLARLTEKKRQLQSQVDVTRKFWSEHPKLLNCVEIKSIKKLILVTSKERKLSNTKWASYSLGFVLFQDSLLKFTIDFIGNYEAQIIRLDLLWVYASKSKPESRLQIQLIAPEVHLVLQCGNQDDRDYWVRAINEATIDHLGTPRQECTNLARASSLLWPPLVRKGSYTFTVGQYQSAKYTGAWVEGKQQGRGTIIWPDGKAFVGYFRKGLYHGRGKLSCPHASENNGKSLEVYEGLFEEGLYHGYGSLFFTNGDHYEGEWYKGQRHGHGRFLLTRNNQYSTYIGEWASGKRNGFGVENATDAEKSYHGIWRDDVREGQGLTITTGDQYCAGRFRDNTLAGRGFIINGQGKSYEGWLSGSMGLNGMGELRLGNDLVISGTFSGRWGEWDRMGSELRIINGLVSKQETARKSIRFDYISWEAKAMKYSATSQSKWCSLFEKCKQVLHLVDSDSPSPPLPRSRSTNRNRRFSREEQDFNNLRRNNTMNNERSSHHTINKSHTLIGINRVNSNGAVRAKKHSFDITVGPVTIPNKVSTPINEDIRKCLTVELKGESVRLRSRSNPEEYYKPDASQTRVGKMICARTTSLNLSIESSQIVETDLTTPSRSPNSKLSLPAIESDPDSSSEISSFNPSSSSSNSQELMLLESSNFTDSQIIINEIKKTLFEQLNTYCSSSTHPLGKLVRDLKDVIFESYAGIGASQYLLPHAILDTKVFLEKLAEIVQKFAPFMIDDKAKLHGMTTQEFLEENIHIIDVYFLSDLFIPRIYHTLFTLFSLFQLNNDSQYETAVSLLSYMRCNDLMTLFSIDIFPSVPDWYKESSQTLSTISQEYTIQGKLNIIKRSVHTMLENLKECNSELTTDVIIPYFQVVIVYARVKKLSTELHYIYTFMDPKLSQGEFGFLLTLLEGCYMLLAPDKLPCRL